MKKKGRQVWAVSENTYEEVERRSKGFIQDEEPRHKKTG